MKKFNPAVLLAVVILTVAGGAIAAGPDSQPATQPSAKEQDIRKLLDVSGSGKLGVQIATQMLGQFSHLFPQVPQEFWSQVENDMKPQDLVDLIVPIYDRHFTDEDIKGLIAFYQSPLGRKLVDQMPQISAESMAAGQEWGRAMGAKVAERLKQSGYLKT